MVETLHGKVVAAFVNKPFSEAIDAVLAVALEEAARVIETECHDDMTREEEAAAIRAMIPVHQ